MSARPFLTGSLLLAMAPAVQAITLGDISVRSTLGQRLQATVPVYLNAGEALAGGCVAPRSGTSDLRRVPGAKVTTPEATREGVYEVQVTSASALYEPMYELELMAHCPGAPGLIRQYVLMLDLPAATLAIRTPATATRATEPPIAQAPTAQAPTAQAPTAQAPTAQAPTAQAPTTPATIERPGAAQRRLPARPLGATIEEGMRYRVVKGDTLSSIAARVRSRTVTLWALADAIQAANPGAFIRNDANLISLGSEILIPGGTEARSPVTIPVATPEPTTTAIASAAPPSVPVPVPVPVIEIVPPAESSAAPPAAVVVTATPVVRTAASVQRRAPAPPVAAAPTDEVDGGAADEPNPVVAATAGILFGLSISTLLWFLGRRPSQKKRSAGHTGDSKAQPAFSPTLLAAATETRAGEPGFSVYYTPPQDDALAAEFADAPEPTAIAPAVKASPAAAQAPSPDVTAELEELFNGTDTSIQKRLNAEKSVAARSLGNPSAADKDASADFDRGSAVDFLVGDPTSEEATLAGRTAEQPKPNVAATAQSGTLDLQALSASATRDEDQAQTLLEALTLLQRDYEEELTASQVLDQSAVRAILGKELDEPTQIRETGVRKAPSRAKSG
jgi:phage tail protein X